MSNLDEKCYEYNEKPLPRHKMDRTALLLFLYRMQNPRCGWHRGPFAQMSKRKGEKLHTAGGNVPARGQAKVESRVR